MQTPSNSPNHDVLLQCEHTSFHSPCKIILFVFTLQWSHTNVFMIFISCYHALVCLCDCNIFNDTKTTFMDQFLLLQFRQLRVLRLYIITMNFSWNHENWGIIGSFQLVKIWGVYWGFHQFCEAFRAWKSSSNSIYKADSSTLQVGRMYTGWTRHAKIWNLPAL